MLYSPTTAINYPFYISKLILFKKNSFFWFNKLISIGLFQKKFPFLIDIAL